MRTFLDDGDILAGPNKTEGPFEIGLEIKVGLRLVRVRG